MRTRVTVCLCTYRRPQLAATLNSIAALQLPSDVDINISIADNDPLGSGKPIVDAFCANNDIEVHYQIQPEKNISLTRNMTVANANGDYLAFIDDDEEADSQWLLRLLECAQTYQAAAVVGQVDTIYPPESPAWIREGNFLGRQTEATGSQLSVGLTGNSLVRRDALPHPSSPFDKKMGTTGGEDSAFFSAIAQNGGKIIACREAVVTETAEPHRLNAAYLLAQATRIGETYACTFIAPKSLISRSFHCLRAMLQSWVGAIAALACKPFSKKYSFQYQMLMQKNMGKVRYLMKRPPVELYK
ncbi:glycosyltransferase family 2 protein [Ferrimonas lipolytica]|uniref:Glycosyltransferase family 2 protein n=1 Tax=Ferrimonas lipolytica TaxID=2724191 RepID=A0A6H1UH66_9GAMM|nr:glycosyltransferase family 2 protein [Ferrimonas lipolytica]QIZ78447.1 glycosyltransferase family 2 protein [Ferrimonas lipolytica]